MLNDFFTDRERWAEDHGYYHWTYRDCGMSGWTDTTPDCACREKEIDDEAVGTEQEQK